MLNVCNQTLNASQVVSFKFVSLSCNVKSVPFSRKEYKLREPWPSSVCKVPKMRTPRKQHQTREHNIVISSMLVSHLMGTRGANMIPCLLFTSFNYFAHDGSSKPLLYLYMAHSVLYPLPHCRNHRNNPSLVVFKFSPSLHEFKQHVSCFMVVVWEAAVRVLLIVDGVNNICLPCTCESINVRTNDLKHAFVRKFPTMTLPPLHKN